MKKSSNSENSINNNLLVNNIINQVNNIPVQSKIIKTNEEYLFIKNSISSNNNTIIKLKLLYQFSIDGYTNNENFFSKIHNKSPTISLILTNNGCRFGCYTQVDLSKNVKAQYINVPDAFIFNLDNKKTFKVKNANGAIYWNFNNSYLLSFGDGDFAALYSKHYTLGFCFYLFISKNNNNFYVNNINDFML